MQEGTPVGGCLPPPLTMKSRHLVDDLVGAGPLWIQVEEDIDVTVAGLGEVVPNGRILCIVSGGCSIIGLLLAGVREVIAVDINKSQLEVARLKLRSLAHFSTDELYDLWLGDSSDKRKAVYQKIHQDMGKDERRWLDEWLPEIIDGIPLVDAGGMEGVGSEIKRTRPELYWKLHQWLQSGEKDASFLEEAAWFVAELRQERSERHFGNGVSLESDDRNVAAEMKTHFIDRFRFLVSSLPIVGNPYLAHMLLGTYPEFAMPTYFTDTGRRRLRDRLYDVTLLESDLSDAIASMQPASLDGADISNVGDYLPLAEWERLFHGLRRVVRLGGAVVHRNFIWDEPYAVSPGFRRDVVLSRRLHARDRSFVYRAFTVDRRVGETDG